jgi:hypothetical protein|nr:MAG TPA: hypothetical protein [Caudoviricetes sp.]
MSQNPILPYINAAGTWVLKAPYDTLLSKQERYTCISVTKLEKLVSMGDEPYDDYYEPKSIPQDTYQNDLISQVCIITVRDEAGQLYSFPSSYLVSFPSGNGVEYGVLGLAVTIGPLPIDTNLTELKQRVKDLVKDTVGVEGDVVSLLLSNPEIVSFASHESMKASRKLNIRESNTTPAQVKALESELRAARNKIQTLEAALIKLKKKAP